MNLPYLKLPALSSSTQAAAQLLHSIRPIAQLDTLNTTAQRNIAGLKAIEPSRRGYSNLWAGSG